jgi:3' exoribonuclease family, domain 1
MTQLQTRASLKCRHGLAPFCSRCCQLFIAACLCLDAKCTTKTLWDIKPDSTQVILAGPGSVGRHPADAGDLAAALTHVLRSHLAGPDTVDLAQLVIEAHKQCWRVIMDVHVLNDDGSVLDACLFAAVASLSNLQVCSSCAYVHAAACCSIPCANKTQCFVWIHPPHRLSGNAAAP